jgi:uncharacterized protein YjiS (DUF1127 family)
MESKMYQSVRESAPRAVTLAQFGGKAPSFGATSLLDKFMRLLDRSHQREALGQLERHQLDDIGITRAEARREARKRFWE